VLKQREKIALKDLSRDVNYNAKISFQKETKKAYLNEEKFVGNSYPEFQIF